jgi:hypothetical protein
MSLSLCLLWASGQSTNTTGNTGHRLTSIIKSSIISELRGKPLICGSSLLVGSGLAAKGTYRDGV